MSEHDCECVTWGRSGKAVLLYLRHHPNCDKYQPESEVRDLLIRLINGIGLWAQDEDGVHPDCVDAYNDACDAVGSCRRKINEASGDE